MHRIRNIVNIHEWAAGPWEINWALACVSTLSGEGVRAQVISYSGEEAVQNLSIKANPEWKALTLHHSQFPADSKDLLEIRPPGDFPA